MPLIAPSAQAEYPCKIVFRRPLAKRVRQENGGQKNESQTPVCFVLYISVPHISVAPDLTRRRRLHPRHRF